MKYIIIGNSAAAVGAVEGIRQVDSEGEITLVSDEIHHTYSRPLISYWLMGKTTPENMRYRSTDFYDRNRCVFMGGCRAIGIDPDKKEVTLADQRVLGYDKLLVATGSSPFIPPVDGLERVEKAFTFMKYDDAARLQEALTPQSKVLIIGAGLIGLKCAEGIAGRAAEITVVDLAPTILSSVLTSEGAEIVQRQLEAQGLRFLLGRKVWSFEAQAAILDSGERVEFDIVVLAVGVRPNTELLRGIAVIERGIVVDEKMATSQPNIYAAGDCTQSFDVSSGQQKIMALLPNAYMQGCCAGQNMAGAAAVFDRGLPMNAVGFFGLHILTAGTYTGSVYSEVGNGNYKKLFYEQNRLKGFILIGNIEKTGIYTSLIRERTPLDSIDFAMICRTPGLMAFSRKERQLKLGGGSNGYIG